MGGNLTPEERLLRVIESGGEQGRVPLGMIHSWSAVLKSYKQMTGKMVRAQFGADWIHHRLSLKRLNQGLLILFFLSGAWLAYDIKRVNPHIEDLTAPALVPIPSAEQEEPSPSLKPITAYVEEVKKRDLFSPASPPRLAQPKVQKAQKTEPVKAQAPPPPTPLEILRQKAVALKLVGTSFGQTPIAILEDTSTRKTYFLKVGDSINQMQLESITEGRAILSYQGARYELF